MLNLGILLSSSGQPAGYLTMFVSPRLRKADQHLELRPPMELLYKDTDHYLDNSLHSKTFPRLGISTRSSVRETGFFGESGKYKMGF